jgi:hypothetical protein
LEGEIWQFPSLATVSLESHLIYPPLHITTLEGQIKISPNTRARNSKILERQLERISMMMMMMMMMTTTMIVSIYLLSGKFNTATPTSNTIITTQRLLFITIFPKVLLSMEFATFSPCLRTTPITEISRHDCAFLG